jgi:PEP-CTERM motif
VFGIASTIFNAGFNGYHALSTDPALPVIVNEINNNSVSSDIPVTAYAYSDAPAQYASAVSTLTAYESTLGEAPFDVLLVYNTGASPSPNDVLLSIGFNGNTVAPTAISNIINVGEVVVPEPTSAMLFGAGLLGISLRRRVLAAQSTQIG